MFNTKNFIILESPYYNTELTTTTSSTTKGSQNTYDAFQTLV